MGRYGDPRLAFTGMTMNRYSPYLTISAAVLLALFGGLGIGLLWNISPLLSLLVGGTAVIAAVLVWYLGFWTRTQDELSALRDQLDRARQSEAQLQDKLRVQETMLGQLTAQIEALTVPTIPIREGVVVVPLIGALQVEQVERIGQNLLHEIERRNARVAILDLTGVTALTAPVISVLTRLFAAVELMGCQTVITGLSTETVRELLRHKPDLHVQARLNLEAGIAYANHLLE